MAAACACYPVGCDHQPYRRCEPGSPRTQGRREDGGRGPCEPSGWFTAQSSPVHREPRAQAPSSVQTRLKPKLDMWIAHTIDTCLCQAGPTRPKSSLDPALPGPVQGPVNGQR
jgi:hypothetical protein